MMQTFHSTTRSIFLVALGLSLGSLSCKTGASDKESPSPEEAVASEPLVQELQEMEWWRKSMETRDGRMGWFRESRFGMFIHFGVYSHLGGVWDGDPVKGYAEHIQRIKKISVDDYKAKVAAKFNPTAFNADDWCGAAKRAGMGYFVITAKHHDGFAMFDSNVSAYNVVKASAWKRDPMMTLKEACKKQGVRFGFYYSHAWDWEAAGGPGEGWGLKRNANTLPSEEEAWLQANPPAAEKIRAYVDNKAIPQLKELISQYDPDILWFDTPSHLPLSANLRILKAVREAKPGIVVSGRVSQGAPNGPKARFGDYLSTTDKPAEFPPSDGDWEGIPTTNESYGWHKEDKTHKTPEHFIQLLAKAAARGGNLLLNIGPMGDGKFDPKDTAILDGIGKWMKVNGESIKGTERTPLAVQAWGQSTRKGGKLYLHVMVWPKKGHIVVGGLKSNVKAAYLLADPKKQLKVERLSPLDVAIQGPKSAPDGIDTVVVLEVEGEISADKRRLLSTDIPIDALVVFDGKLAGDLAFGEGKARNAFVQYWDSTDDSVDWKIRVREKATFEIAAVYDADKKSTGGTFSVRFGQKALSGTVTETPAEPVKLGKVTLEPGESEVLVTAEKVVGGELFRLRGLLLTPVATKN